MANSVDPDQMLQSTASDLGLQCLLRPFCCILRTNMIASALKSISTISELFCKLIGQGPSLLNLCLGEIKEKNARCLSSDSLLLVLIRS